MDTATLDDFETLNSQVAALVEAGVPLDVGLPYRARGAAEELEQISATVARRMNRGESLSEALQGDERDVPAAYRGVMQFGAQANVTAALASSSRVAVAVEDSRFAIERAILYPLIICVLAYVGLVAFCLYWVPMLAQVYGDLRQPPGAGFRALNALREAIPYWAPVPPLLLLAIEIARWRSRSRRIANGVAPNRILAWIPGASRILFQEHCSRFAASLGTLLDNRVPFKEALAIAADASGDAELARGARAISADPEAQLPSEDSTIAMLFPPFLRWAIWHSEATTGRARALELAAQTYHDAAERSTERLNSAAPIAALVLVGGVVTLLYCLALFLPLTELLHTLAQ